MKYTSFYDMHSGGRRKSKHDLYLIAGDEATARRIFERETGCNPENVTCHCCGEDYSVIEWTSKEEALKAYGTERDVEIIEA